MSSGYLIADAVKVVSIGGSVHTITATTGANGTISPSGDVIVSDGDDQSFTISPYNGYHVLDVLVDGSSIGAVTTYTFSNVTVDHTIDVTFETNNEAEVIVDHSDLVNFTTTGGTWSHSTYNIGYYDIDYQYSGPGDGSKIASWRFNIAVSGTYNIFAQWTSSPNRTVQAPYTIYNNGIEVNTVLMDQTVNGGQFNSLGLYTLENGNLEIVLSNNVSSGYLIADAVKVVSIGGSVHTITATTGANGTISPSGDVISQ